MRSALRASASSNAAMSTSTDRSASASVGGFVVMRVRDGTEETKRPTDFVDDSVRARTDRLTGAIVTLSDQCVPLLRNDALQGRRFQREASVGETQASMPLCVATLFVRSVAATPWADS